MTAKELEAYELVNDSDEIPDEPLNQQMVQLRQDLKDNYSYNPVTGQFPEDRVKMENGGTSNPYKGKIKRVQSACNDIQYRQGVRNLKRAKRVGTANRRTPIMA